ncbi:hypothetical protein CONLIGDRAFT_631352 [Coniochaeta ligniaria NRRL 30616]|uniref:Uncharacterized protein n=1 Tax=Coniochaeta ligniaria NRRL 30616 TaxID=1408157 RepID=A0A1J7JPY7_9PEZI|nr:hypothetical protein CONLIGDRAFT_631352 [Coniochaeta ligniaria NRRL 30616]
MLPLPGLVPHCQPGQLTPHRMKCGAPSFPNLQFIGFNNSVAMSNRENREVLGRHRASRPAEMRAPPSTLASCGRQSRSHGSGSESA